MNRKVPIVLCLVICVLLAVIVLPKGADTAEKLQKYGELEKQKQEAIASGKDYIVAKGNSIEVYNAAVENITEGYSLTSGGKTREDAIEFLAERAALVEEAKRNGITVSDSEVKDYIALQKEAGRNAVNMDEFESFLKGAEMTYDEYWDSQYEMLEQELYIGKLSGIVKIDDEYRKEILAKEKLVILD